MQNRKLYIEFKKIIVVKLSIMDKLIVSIKYTTEKGCYK